MKSGLLIRQFRDLLVPVTVAGIIPYLMRNTWTHAFIPDSVFLKIIAVALTIPALIVFSYTIYFFHVKGKGTLAPWTEKEKLVVAGPYRYVRNPMIASLLVVLFSEALFFHSAAIWTYAMFFYTVNTFYFMFSEEPYLEKRFGEDYVRYRAHVKRWWPRLKRYFNS